MKEKIKNYLSELEKDKGIEILLACETGSRAWGFPSPDSDFDVRIIYKHDKNWYLSLTEGKDTLECFYENNDIDISGWDLRKCLRLLWKSNPPLLERIQSPIIYKVDEVFQKEIKSIAHNHYSRIATIHHYMSMAKKALEDVTSSNEYRLKRFFYALRASVACIWIIEEEEIPPIEFGIMLDRLDLPEKMIKRVQELIKLKSTISEAYMHKGEHDLIEFMKSCIEKAENESKSLPPSNGQMSELNTFLIKELS